MEEINGYKITGGPSLAEGRPEIKVRGEWGTICDDFWDLNSANQFCMMVGYKYVYETVKRYLYTHPYIMYIVVIYHYTCMYI